MCKDNKRSNKQAQHIVYYLFTVAIASISFVY